jgi:hypothetical protein
MTKNIGNIKILNLDTLPTKAPKRSITVGGVNYPVRDMSVEDFIETNAAADRLKDSVDVGVQLDETIASIKRSADIPDEVLSKLPLEKLGVLAAFIRGMFDPDAADIEEGTGEEPKK